MNAALTVEPRPPVFTRAVVAVTLINFVFFTTYLFFFPTLPFFIEELGGAEGEIGLLIGISSLTALFARPFVGLAVDRIGRKPVMVAGLLAFAVNAALYHLVRSPAGVLPLRLLTGASLALFVTSAGTYIADVAPAARRGEVMSYYGLANSLAFAAGPALGGWIIHAGLLDGFDSAMTSRATWLSGARTGDLHFATLFLVATVAALLTAVLAVRLPETRVTAQGPPRGLDPRQLFARAALFPALVNFATSFVFAAMVTFMPLFARDHGIANPGGVFAVYALFVILMRLALGRQIDKRSRATVIIPGIGALVVSMAVLSLATGPAMIYLSAAIYGAGAGTFQPAMMAFMVDRSSPSERGRAMSTFTLGNDLGLSMGAFALGLVVESASYPAAFLVAMAAAVAGLAIFIAGAARPHHQHPA